MSRVHPLMRIRQATISRVKEIYQKNKDKPEKELIMICLQQIGCTRKKLSEYFQAIGVDL